MTNKDALMMFNLSHQKNSTCIEIQCAFINIVNVESIKLFVIFFYIHLHDEIISIIISNPHLFEILCNKK